MLKRHEIQFLRRAGHSQLEVATVAGVSRRTVQRIDIEVAVGWPQEERVAPPTPRAADRQAHPDGELLLPLDG